jgi:hypothetical protein
MFGKNKTEEVVEEKKKPDEDWMTKKWRPMMAMMYMTCCLFDFALFPIMFTIVQFWEVQAANDAFRQWVPITLQGGGLFHVAMGGVLGVSAYGRTQEKVAGAANVSTSTSVPTPELSSAPPVQSPSSFGGGFNSAPMPSASSNSFSASPIASSNAFGSTPVPSSGYAGGFDSTPDAGFGSTQTKPIVRRPV